MKIKCKKATPLYLVIPGVVGSVFGFNSLLVQSETVAQNTVSDSDYSLKNDSKNNGTEAVCSGNVDMFAQDESQVLLSQYSEPVTAECLFVGCGGII